MIQVLFWGGLGSLIISVIALAWLEELDANRIPKWLWWTVTAMFFGGFASLMISGVTFAIVDALTSCVPDQSALAGVCVPEDQAG